MFSLLLKLFFFAYGMFASFPSTCSVVFFLCGFHVSINILHVSIVFDSLLVTCHVTVPYKLLYDYYYSGSLTVTIFIFLM